MTAISQRTNTPKDGEKDGWLARIAGEGHAAFSRVSETSGDSAKDEKSIEIHPYKVSSLNLVMCS